MAYLSIFKRFFNFRQVVERLSREGRLEIDKPREYAIDYLDKLAGTLKTNQSTLWSLFPKCGPELKRGVYIYGSVGSGKTMLMDLFYENVKISDKSRFHYNQFMLQFHTSTKLRLTTYVLNHFRA